MIWKKLLSLITFLVLSTSTTLAQFVDPIMKFFEKEHDFGSIRQGEIVEYIFPFVNVGEDTLKIFDISASCGCSAGLLTKREYAKGDTGYLKVKFDSHGRQGQHINKIYIKTNDIYNPLTVLQIRAYVYIDYKNNLSNRKSIILLEKYFHDFGKIKEGEVYSAIISVKNVGNDALIIGEVISNCNCIEAIPKSRKIQPGSSNELKILFDSTNLSGLITRTIKIFSNDFDNPVVYLTVQGEVIQ